MNTYRVIAEIGGVGIDSREWVNVIVNAVSAVEAIQAVEKGTVWCMVAAVELVNQQSEYILLVRDYNKDTWMAHRFDKAGKPDQQTIDLFDTHIVPTPYTTRAAADTVIQAIQARNPNVIVKAA